LTRYRIVYKNIDYMETITKEKFIHVFREKSISLFEGQDIFKVFDINPDAAKALFQRLKKGKIVQSLTRGKYLFLLAKKLPEDFEIANFLYKPSYISLETALSFYGIIDQFSYQILSVALRKTRTFRVEKKSFVYAHTRPEFFRDFKKEGNYLIATPEKSIFDFLYLVYKGGRPKSNLNLLHLERANLDKTRLADYINELAQKHDQKFIKFCQNQNTI